MVQAFKDLCSAEIWVWFSSVDNVKLWYDIHCITVSHFKRRFPIFDIAQLSEIAAKFCCFRRPIFFWLGRGVAPNF